jgi:hypothetical protein
MDAKYVDATGSIEHRIALAYHVIFIIALHRRYAHWSPAAPIGERSGGSLDPALVHVRT